MEHGARLSVAARGDEETRALGQPAEREEDEQRWQRAQPKHHAPRRDRVLVLLHARVLMLLHARAARGHGRGGQSPPDDEAQENAHIDEQVEEGGELAADALG